MSLFHRTLATVLSQQEVNSERGCFSVCGCHYCLVSSSPKMKRDQKQQPIRNDTIGQKQTGPVFAQCIVSFLILVLDPSSLLSLNSLLFLVLCIPSYTTRLDSSLNLLTKKIEHTCLSNPNVTLISVEDSTRLTQSINQSINIDTSIYNSPYEYSYSIAHSTQK